jgi:protein O-mannosyl-transferase
MPGCLEDTYVVRAAAACRCPPANFFRSGAAAARGRRARGGELAVPTVVMPASTEENGSPSPTTPELCAGAVTTASHPVELPAPRSHLPSFVRDGLAATALAVVTFVVFLPALGNGFVNIDDPDYVTNNVHVKAGLSEAGVRWAFSSFESFNWHPLTWLSLQLDAALWKTAQGEPDPRGFHLTSVVVHAANAALLFLALRALTGAYWRSAAVALLFAVHPLRAESVAWVAERKDVLNTFFGLVALWAYPAYVRRPSVVRYLAVAGPFALSLLCKPMLVTLPCLLLVLDWWPLGRWPTRGAWLLVREKLPLFALAVAASVVTTEAQQGGTSAVGDLTMFPPSVRLANAALSYIAYLSKTFWPARLGVYYPHPVFDYAKDGGLSLTRAAAAGAAVVVLSGVAIALRRRAPYLLTGWLWFLGTLVPTIGVVQVGTQAYADRYTYLPQVGILLAICWAAGDLAAARSALRIAAAAAVVAAAAALALATRAQIAFWHDSLDLWAHNFNAAGPSPGGFYLYGEALVERNRADEAMGAYRQSLQLDPSFYGSHISLGKLLLAQHNLDEAARHFDRALQFANVKSSRAFAHLKLGYILAEKGDLKGAARHDDEATHLAPDWFDGYFQLGQVRSRLNDLVPAAESFQRALRLKPEFARAHTGLGDTLIRLGRIDEGIAELRAAVRCEPRFGRGHLLLGMELEKRGEVEDAFRQYEEAVKYNPEFALAWYKLGDARARQGRASDAVEYLSQAVERDPKSVAFRGALATALDVLAGARAREGRFAEAAETAGRARDEAAKAGRADLAQQIEARRARYERGEAGTPVAPTDKP